MNANKSWFEKNGFKLFLVAIFILVIIFSTNSCRPSADEVKRARAMEAEILTLKRGDLIQVGGYLEVIQDVSIDNLRSIRCFDRSYVNRVPNSASYVIDRIVRAGTQEYTNACVDCIQQLAR